MPEWVSRHHSASVKPFQERAQAASVRPPSVRLNVNKVFADRIVNRLMAGLCPIFYCSAKRRFAQGDRATDRANALPRRAWQTAGGTLPRILHASDPGGGNASALERLSKETTGL